MLLVRFFILLLFGLWFRVEAGQVLFSDFVLRESVHELQSTENNLMEISGRRSVVLLGLHTRSSGHHMDISRLSLLQPLFHCELECLLPEMALVGGGAVPPTVVSDENSGEDGGKGNAIHPETDEDLFYLWCYSHPRLAGCIFGAACSASSFSFSEVPNDLLSNVLEFNSDTGYLRIQSYDGENRTSTGTILDEDDPLRYYLLEVHSNVQESCVQAHKKILARKNSGC